jgi:hypothetical protein
MCIITAPILTKPQGADQPITRWPTVNKECCIGPIDHHSPPPRSSSPLADSEPRMPHRTLTTQEGIRDTTERGYGHEDMTTGRSEDNAFGRESAAGRLQHSRWSSSARVIIDRPPSQPHSFRQMSWDSRIASVN